MNRRTYPIWQRCLYFGALGVLLVGSVVYVGSQWDRLLPPPPEHGVRPGPEQETIHSPEEAVAVINNLGGGVAHGGDGSPANPVTVVGLDRVKIRDEDLKYLKPLTELHTLTLTDSPVADAGLVHLRGLTRLETLFLNDTQVSGPGLVHLQGLSSLRVLHLAGTAVDDAGLAHLRELRSLENWSLTGTKVTARAWCTCTGWASCGSWS